MVVDGDADGDGGGAAAAAVLNRNIWDNRTNIKEVYFAVLAIFLKSSFKIVIFLTHIRFIFIWRRYGESLLV